MYLDCVECWIGAFEVLVYEVYTQAGRKHCYKANQEDANDSGYGRSANAPENGSSGSATFFPTIDVEL
jgi:hypothetical protein